MKMREIIKKYYHFIIILVFLYYYWFYIYEIKRLPSFYNDKVCDFVRSEVKGIIKKKFGHGIYHYIVVGDKTYAYSISKIIAIEKFKDKRIHISVGDSIIKQAFSKKMIIKRGDSSAIYLLDCYEN